MKKVFFLILVLFFANCSSESDSETSNKSKDVEISVVSGLGKSSTEYVANWNKLVSDISNATFKVIPYKNINTMGKRWIRKYTLALSKELLGTVRSKFASLPIPNSEIQLNGDSLKQEGREDQQLLVEELKELLDATSFGAMMEGDTALQNAINEQLQKAPSPIFIG